MFSKEWLMKLKKGMNLGGFLSQCVHVESHYKSFIIEQDIQTIAAWGFDHVRLPIDYEVFEEEDGKSKEAWYQIVANVVEWCKNCGLDIILDLHKAYGYDFNDAGNAAKNNLFSDDKLQERFIHLWQEIARQFADKENVALELLNEVVEKENAISWNKLIEKTVLAIREISEAVPIIYGGIQWNSVKTLKLLENPHNKNIKYTFHFYEPLLFTHQKAHWVELMDKQEDVFYPETMEYFKAKSESLGYQGEVVTKANSKTMGKEFISEMIEEAVTAAQKAGVGLYCGEFGVIDQAPLQDTLRWFQDVDGVFNEFGIGYALWTYKDMDFGLKNEHYDEIREPLIELWSRE